MIELSFAGLIATLRKQVKKIDCLEVANIFILIIDQPS